MIAYLLEGDTWRAGAELPITDRAFRYGMSVFETIAVIDRRPLFLDEHLDRLAAGAAAAELFPPDSWRGFVAALFSENPITTGVVRIYLTGGDFDGGPSRLVALAETMEIPAAAGIATLTATVVEMVPGDLPVVKTGNYWPHLRVQRSAAGRGFDDAIRATSAGRLIGGSMANLFLVRNGGLATPRPAPGVRDGVVRGWILARFGASEMTLTVDDLLAADECFFTNSRIGIQSVSSVDTRPCGPPNVAGRIWCAYRESVLHAP